MRAFLLALLLALTPQLAFTQDNPLAGQGLSLLALRLEYDRSGEIAKLYYADNQAEFIRRYRGPQGPNLPQITFYQFNKPQHLQGRINAMLHGVTILLPPEYDHYGYEIRRYMNNIANHGIYDDPATWQAQKKNIVRARIVFKYWRDDLEAHIRTLRRDVQDNKGTSKMYSTLEFNSSVLRAFMVEIQGWLTANEQFLDYIDRKRDVLNYQDGRLLISEKQALEDFLALYAAREEARRLVQKYDPFYQIIF